MILFRFVSWKLLPFRKSISALVVIFGLLILCVPAFSQLNLGRIFGAVTDQTGGAIAGATVTVIDEQRGVSRPLTTDADGQFAAPSLVPGTYTVRAEFKGFQTAEHTGIVVGVGGDLRVDLSMQPGEQTQTVTVTGDLPMVDTTSAELGGTVENRDLTDLPINGRSYAKLFNYTPGAVSVNGNDTFFEGVRYTQNVYLFDGVDEFNYVATGPVAGGTNGFTEATIVPVDAIQEVHIITDGRAEYGWRSGGVINLGIKSGTNSLHGTAFAMGRNAALDARNGFSTAAVGKSSDNLTQQGATLGGPIKKDKIFFFIAYEGQNYSVGTPATLSVPITTLTSNSKSLPNAVSLMEAAGYCNPAAAGCTNPISQLSLNMAGCTLPAGLTGPATCTGGLFNPTPGSALTSTAYSSALNSTGGSENGLGKIDYHVNDHNNINGEYFIGIGQSNEVGASTAEPWWVPVRYTRPQLARGVWVWTPNSTWLNEMRFGYERQRIYQVPAECVQNLGQPDYATQYGFVSGVTSPIPDMCGFPTFSISGLTGFGGNTGNGGVYNVLSNFAGLDTVSYTRGRHQFKFGFEIHTSLLNGAAKAANATGTIKFGSIPAPGLTSPSALEDFLAGTVGSSSVLVGNPLRNMIWPRDALFIQDDWRVTPKLTVNLGLRWEVQPALRDANGQTGGFLPTAPLGLVQQGIQESALYKTDYKAFGPRLGLAWDLTGKGTTVVRAGGGIQYSANSFNAMMSSVQGAAVNQIPTGWTLYGPMGNVLSGPGNPGNITTGNLSASNGSLVNWLPNTPIFDTSTNLLACGNGLGSVMPGVAAGGANPQNPAPCNIFPVSANLKPGYITTYTLSVQHAFTNNLSLTVAYVGTHGTDLVGVQDINQPLPGIANTKSSPGNENEQLRRPFTQNCAAPVFSGTVLVSGTPGGLGLNPSQCFPFLGLINQFMNGAVSNYNGLQTTLEQRISHGLFFTANYTWSHSLDDTSNDYGSFFMNSVNIKQDYGSSDYNFPQQLSLRVTYNIPGIKSPGQLLQGWQVNTVISVLSGQPYNAEDSSTDISGTGEVKDRWTIAGSPANIKSGVQGTGPVIPCFGIAGSSFAGSGCTTVTAVANLPTACVAAATAEPSNPNVPGSLNGLGELASFGCYYENGTAIVPPAQGTFGSMGRNVLYNSLPYREVDASVNKTWLFKERYNVQFRAEAFNLLNKVIYANPSGDPSSPSTFAASSSANNSGDPILGNGGPRQIALSLKITF